MMPGILGFMVSKRASAAPPGITQVQNISVGSTNQAASFSISATNGWATPTAGNIIIFMVVADTTVSGTPSGYTLVNSSVDFAGAYMYFKVSAGTESTITIALSGTKSCIVAAYEYSGLSAIDKSASATGQGTGSVSTGTTAATTVANELVIAMVGLSQGNTTTQPTVTSWTNSFVTDINTPSTGIGTIMRLETGIKTVSATGTQTSTATLSAAGSANNSGIIGTFN